MLGPRLVAANRQSVFAFSVFPFLFFAIRFCMINFSQFIRTKHHYSINREEKEDFYYCYTNTKWSISFLVFLLFPKKNYILHLIQHNSKKTHTHTVWPHMTKKGDISFLLSIGYGLYCNRLWITEDFSLRKKTRDLSRPP